MERTMRILCKISTRGLAAVPAGFKLFLFVHFLVADIDMSGSLSADEVMAVTENVFGANFGVNCKHAIRVQDALFPPGGCAKPDATLCEFLVAVESFVLDMSKVKKR